MMRENPPPQTMLPPAEQRRGEHWMRRALELARCAQAQGEVPVGAVVVLDGECLAEGWNRPIGLHDPSAHAEIVALRAAAARQRNYRLPGATLYVTLEPCIMCAGAILNARIAHLVFAARDAQYGAAGSRLDVLQTGWLNARCRVTGGLLEQPARQLLQDFFRARRG